MPTRAAENLLLGYFFFPHSMTDTLQLSYLSSTDLQMPNQVLRLIGEETRGRGRQEQEVASALTLSQINLADLGPG